MPTRIVIDTNILILLESNAPVVSNCARLLSLLQQNSVHVLVHPASLEDIANDKDEVRREISLSKLQKYGALKAPPALIPELFEAAGVKISNSNDLIDCIILTALIKDAVHFLVTEDRGLHSRARLLRVSDRVLTIEQALTLFSAAFSNETIDLPNLDSIFLHQLRDELVDPFFDTLRTDYIGFDDWFVRACKEGRPAWIARDYYGKLGAICIYKEEKDPQVTSDTILFGRTLKLCTLKVEKNVRGQKLGELLLKAAIRHASQNLIEKIYITAKARQVELIDLLADFGFEHVGSDHNLDGVYVKEQPLAPPISELDPVTYHVKYSPHFKGGPSVRKFLVPIQPKFHEQLFPGKSDQQLKLPLVANIPGNAIKLAYLCRSNVTSIEPGDILVFYRSGDIKACTTIGIVESVDRLSDADMILEKVLKRTVYTRSDIEGICERGCLTLLFRLQNHFAINIQMDRLERIGVNGPIQSIRKITDEQFLSIARLGQCQDCISTH